MKKKILSLLSIISLPITGVSVISCGAGKTKIINQQATQKELKAGNKTPKEPKTKPESTPIIEKNTLDNNKKLINIVQSKDKKWLNNLINNYFIDNNLEITKYDFYIIRNWRTAPYGHTVKIREKILDFLKKHKGKIWNEIKNKNSAELKKYNEENFKINKISPIDIMNVGDKEYIVFSLEFNISKEEINKNYIIDFYKIINNKLTEPMWL